MPVDNDIKTPDGAALESRLVALGFENAAYDDSTGFLSISSYNLKPAVAQVLASRMEKKGIRARDIEARELALLAGFAAAGDRFYDMERDPQEIEALLRGELDDAERMVAKKPPTLKI